MPPTEVGPGGDAVLVARVRGRACALPLRSVVETMRPLPVTRLAGAPDWVQGMAVIRGEPVPVVDLAGLLFGSAADEPTRFVTLRVGDRRVAVATGDVLGVRTLPASGAPPPPLLAESAVAVEAIGRLDDALLLVLSAARLLPDAAGARP